MKPLDEFTNKQNYLIGLVSYFEDVVAKTSCNFFRPEWAFALIRRFRKNNSKG